jgi:hypothetical protein
MSTAMDRINHVKIVTPDPGAVEKFLTEVVDIPAGWSLGAYPPPPEGGGGVAGPARNADGTFTLEGLMAWRGRGSGGGMIVGSPESRQFQVFHADAPKVWGVAIGTRHVERAHDRCVERGLPCTDVQVTPWGQSGGAVTFFFVEVGGIVFEVLRAEDSARA